MRFGTLATVAAISGFAWLVAGSACAASQSDFWSIASDGPGEIFVYFDAGTLMTQGRTKTGWTTWIMKGSQVTPKKGSRQLLEYEFDCAEHRLGVKDFVYYDAAGRVLDFGQSDAINLDDVVPGSIGATLIDFACSDYDAWSKNNSYLHLRAGFDPQANADFMYSEIHRPPAVRRKRAH